MSRHVILLFILVLATSCPTKGWAADIPVDSVLLRVIEEVEVPAQELGVLAEVVVWEGQTVAADELLAQIDDTEVKLARQRAKLELDIANESANNDVRVRFAKKAVEVVKAELQRAKDSVQKYPKAVSDTEMDRLRLTVEKATLDIEQAEHELTLAKLTQKLKENEYQFAVHREQRRKIVAPFGGVVVQVSGRRGEWVEPGKSVLRILRIDRLKAEGFVNANQLRHDLTGSQVELTLDLPGQTQAKFPGKVVFVSPEIDPVNGQVRVWAEIENRGLRLRPGLRAAMTIRVPASN